MISYEVMVDGQRVPLGDYVLFRYAQARALQEAKARRRSVRIDRVLTTPWGIECDTRTTLLEVSP